MPAQLFVGPMIQRLPNAAISDLTPPVFAGITALVANTDGSLTASWVNATDDTPPIDYLIYIAVGNVNAATLFQSGHLTAILSGMSQSKKIFNLADQTTYLVKGQVYTVGVRAKDAVGNVNTNTAVMTVTAISSGNFPVVFQSLLDELEASKNAIEAAAQAVTAGAGTQMSFQSTETVMTIETDGVE